MGVWIFYVLPLCFSIVLELVGIKLFKYQMKAGAYLAYFLAATNCVIAAIFAVFYIYALVLELLTPHLFTKLGWIMFWNDNIVFVLVTIILIAINYLVWRRGKRVQLQLR